MSSEHHPHKRLNRLLPAIQDNSSSPFSTTECFATTTGFSGPFIDKSPVVPKRPRIGVSIACDRCRLKKIRCDGSTPSCYACLQRGISKCHYENPSAKNANAGLLREAIGLLNSMTPPKASAALAAVRTLDRDLDIIITLRDWTYPPASQSDDTTGTSSELWRLLERVHPFAYPNLEPIDLHETNNYLERLVAQRTKHQQDHGYQNMTMSSSQAHGDNAQATADAGLIFPAPGRQFPDPSLEGLDISKWTKVAISDDFAMRAISLYFITDHLLLCPFDRKIFTDALVSFDRGPYCSSSLVNALLYWCCLAYASIDPGSTEVVDLFRKEAEVHAEREPDRQQPLDVVTEMFLSLGYLMQGRDGRSLKHLSDASNVGAQLGLFGVPDDIARAAIERLTPKEIQAVAYPAWGVFNWTVLMSLFYRQKGGIYPNHPPIYPIPGGQTIVQGDGEDGTGGSHKASPDLADQEHHNQGIFTSLCHFWSIMHEVATVYHGNTTASTREPPSLQFAEFKFRELLTWADSLPLGLVRSRNDSDVVIILHLYLHSAILDIFRPFIQAQKEQPLKSKLRTFAASDSTASSVYTASVRQLKQLVLSYCSKYSSSSYTFAWQTALLYTANAMLHSTEDDRLEYFLICLYSFQGLRRCFRVTEAIAQALLSMALQQGDISSSLASKILEELRSKAPSGEEVATGGESIKAPFMADLDLAITDPEAATVEQLADKFEESVWMTRYTNVFE